MRSILHVLVLTAWTPLLCTRYAFAEPVAVLPFVLPDAAAHSTPEEKEALRLKAVEVVEKLEEAFPLTARVKLEAKSHIPPRNPARLTESTDITYSRNGSSLFYLCDCLHDQGSGRLERQTFSFDGKKRRLLGYDDARESPDFGSVHAGEEAKSIMTCGASGIEYLLPFYGFNGLSRVLAGGSCIMAAPQWEVLTLTDEQLLLHFWGFGEECIFVELDLAHGGNLIRWEKWTGWGTDAAQQLGHLNRYELRVIGGKWLPTMYELKNVPRSNFDVTYTYEWLDVDLTPTPEHFVLEFPAGVTVSDSTTLAARVVAGKKAMQKQWVDWQISFWGFFD